MKNNLINTVQLFLLLTVISNISFAIEKTVITSDSYFPIGNGFTLIYISSFGESTTKYFNEGEFTISSSEADNFKYKQTLIITNEGVYVKEIYQYFKIFLFFSKESKITFEKPLLRFPLPLLPGMEWEWVGEEDSDGEISKVKVTGKALNKEFVLTKAGEFEAIKIESFFEGSSNVKNRVTEWFVEGIGLIKAKIVIEGGGVMGLLRDILGYGTIEFELKEIRKQQ